MKKVNIGVAGLGFGKEFVRYLQQDSYSVSCFTLGVFAGSMFKIFNNFQGIRYCLMALKTLDVYYSTNTTVIMLQTWII